jgi:DNA-binding XRE family transcriptional regulator
MMSTRIDTRDTMLDEAYSAADVGRVIRRLRAQRRMTQATLAAWCGVSRQTVVAMERGGPVAVTAVIRAIALLGAKIVIAPKDALVQEAPPR